MYSVNPKQLLRSAGGSQEKMIAIRWCLDYLFSQQVSKVTLKKLLKKWPFDPNILNDELFKSSTDYLSMYITDNETIIFSRLIKRYFEQEEIMKQLEGLNELDNKSLSSKANSDIDELIHDNDGKALQSYCNLIPTKNYSNNREVFVITNKYFNYLQDKFPKSDINFELNNLYAYFIENELARRYPRSLKIYIESWIKGDLITLRRINKTKRVRISADEFYRGLMHVNQ